MSQQDPALMTVKIMENEYRVACPEENRESLLAAADYLNSKMSEIRGTGKLLGMERIAVMAALNICHELLSCRREYSQLSESTSTCLQQLVDKIESTLRKSA